MSKLIVKGPVILNGEVTVRGAKNAALPILVAAAIPQEQVILRNIPTDLNDVKVMIEALLHVGITCNSHDDKLNVDGSEITNTEIPNEISNKIRYSLLFLGLLLGKVGHAKISVPGGCNLGDRKFDLHLMGLEKLGAEIRCENGYIEANADKLVGSDIHLYLPTTSGTENIMIAACYAKGRTRIFNANTRPEVENLGAFLNAMGVNVIVKNRVVEIESSGNIKGCDFSIMAGWDEAMTYIIGSALTGGELCVRDFSLNCVKHEVDILKQAGVDIFEWGGSVYSSAKNKILHHYDLFTGPYPAVNSDMQPIFAALASQCNGESSITDQRFTERFAYVAELRKLGIDIQNYGNTALINGVNRLKGNKVKAHDLRCGAAILLASLKADGISVIENTYQIGRGYENITNKLNALGADIEEIFD